MPDESTGLAQAVTFSRRLPRRWILLFLGLITFLAVAILVIAIPSSIPSTSGVQELTDGIPLPSLPKSKIPKVPGLARIWGKAAHPPPVQANSTGVAGEATWYSNWKWLRPFSSSVTLDENRAVLPPFRARPPIYTYYDTTLKKDPNVKEAEAKLLHLWRRAWWAQGFRPVILGRPDAMENPLFETLQSKHLPPTLETDLFRWLAWEHMGSGILASWLSLPMGDYQDPLLSYLRRGRYPKLIRYQTLAGGLFSGNRDLVTAALKEALANPNLNASKSFVAAVPKDVFIIDPAPSSIAFYDTATIKRFYKPIAEKLVARRSVALGMLATLINSHLHATFQEHFSKGIAVLRPPLKHMTTVVAPALDIARSLSTCSDSPVPLSCPPNRPTSCIICGRGKPMPILQPPVFRNDSKLFTIGTVPHPYTLDIIQYERPTMDFRFIRRETTRDPWIVAITAEIFPPPAPHSDAARILALKEAVAGEASAAHSLWLTPEKDVPNDLDWIFGFELPPSPPRATEDAPEPTSPPPSSSSDLFTAAPLTKKERQQEQARLDMAKAAVKSTVQTQKQLRAAVEAWNMVDTEAWRFARAYLARSKVERLKWEEEEKKFTVGSPRGRG